MWLFIHAGIKVNPYQFKGPLVYQERLVVDDGGSYVSMEYPTFSDGIGSDISISRNLFYDIQSNVCDHIQPYVYASYGRPLTPGKVWLL